MDERVDFGLYSRSVSIMGSGGPSPSIKVTVPPKLNSTGV